MKTEWNYTNLADAYLKRPEYSDAALDEIIRIAGLSGGDRICDIGAGVAHLTIPFARAGFTVDAVEPNDAMRGNGMKRTASMPNVSWSEGTGENTGRDSGVYDFVSFGSSFNVCDRARALVETHRLLKPGKWFCCLWNHRNLNDPTQAAIEKIIIDMVPEYAYGSRREDQDGVIADSGLFIDIRHIEGAVVHKQSVADVVDAWRSHATLERQAGVRFCNVVDKIAEYLQSLNTPSLDIPYTTRAWMARRKD